MVTNTRIQVLLLNANDLRFRAALGRLAAAFAQRST
jgi:hypothetical protein